MKNTHLPDLYRIAVQTFEELGFVIPSPVLSETQARAPLAHVVEVRFHGPCDGRLTLFLHGEILPLLAANMLGLASSPDEQLQRDALGEIGNVLCGNVLPFLAGPDAVFRLDAPEVGDSAPPGSEPLEKVRVGIEEGRAEVALLIDGP